MPRLHDIIVRPVITEKSTEQLDRHHAYTFEVSREANKHQIAQAVEALFNVNVESVRTMNFRGKPRRVGRQIGRRANWKKAVVTLREGDSIEIFEGV